MPSKAPTHRPARATTLSDGRGSASSRGYDSRWRRLRLIVLNARPVCEHCGRESAVDVDHRIPLAQGGTNDESNLQALCHACHSRKTVTQDGGMGRRRVERR